MVLHWTGSSLGKHAFHVLYKPKSFKVSYRLVAFLFLDMATLTILYSVLFFFLRAQTKHLLKAGNTTDHHTTDDRMTTHSQWEVTVGTEGDDVEAAHPSPDGAVIVTKSVAIYSEGATHPRNPRPNMAPARRTYNRMNKVSFTLLIYPVLYILLTMPISISRIAQFGGHQWGLTFAHFGAALFSCTGFINVLLYTSTRKGLVSWSRLKFWKKDENDFPPSTGRNARWNPRGTTGDGMASFDSVQMARMDSKTSASSLRALKEELARGAGRKDLESDGESHEES